MILLLCMSPIQISLGSDNKPFNSLSERILLEAEELLSLYFSKKSNTNFVERRLASDLQRKILSYLKILSFVLRGKSKGIREV